MLLSLLQCVLPGLALGLTLAGHTDGETTDRQMSGRYDGLSSCDPVANIFVINVAGPQGAPRRASAMAELEKAGISKYTISNAVTPEDFNYQEILKAGESTRLSVPKRHRVRKIWKGEAALALSHQNIYRRIVEENRSCALVFEDDFRFYAPSTFKDRISRAQLPAEYDFIKLEYGQDKGHDAKKPFSHCFEKSSLGRRPRKAPHRRSLVDVAKWRQPSMPCRTKVIRVPVSGCCTSGYLVSNAGARMLLAANTPLWINADGNMDHNIIRFTPAKDRLPVKMFHFSPPLSWQSDDFDQGGIFDMDNHKATDSA